MLPYPFTLSKLIDALMILCGAMLIIIAWVVPGVVALTIDPYAAFGYVLSPFVTLVGLLYIKIAE